MNEDPFPQYVDCDGCNSTGEEPNGEPCRFCNGEGRHAVPERPELSPESWRSDD